MPGTRYFPCIEPLILGKKKTNKKNTDELNGYYYYLGFRDGKTESQRNESYLFRSLSK